MENRLDLKQFILALLVLGMLVGVIAAAAWIAWKAITGLSPQTSTAVVAGVVTVLVSVFSVLWSKRADRLREIEQEHRKQKLPIYEEFLTLLFKVVMADKAGEQPLSENEMIRFFMGFAQKIIVWGSDDILKEYASFRRLAGKSELQSVLAVERILFAIRRDVGHKNKGLKTGDLLTIFVNDVDSFLLPKADDKITS